jgi:hypothetical protein
MPGSKYPATAPAVPARFTLASALRPVCRSRTKTFMCAGTASCRGGPFDPTTRLADVLAKSTYRPSGVTMVILLAAAILDMLFIINY